MKTQTLISICCGAAASQHFQGWQLCPDCREPTGFFNEDDQAVTDRVWVNTLLATEPTDAVAVVNPDAMAERSITWNDGTVSFIDLDGFIYEGDEIFTPSLKAFAADAKNHALAGVCVLMIFLIGAALVILVGGK